MAVNRRIASVIRRWDNADFNEHKYTIVYASRDSEAIINVKRFF